MTARPRYVSSSSKLSEAEARARASIVNVVGPGCPTCHRRWPSLRPDGASQLDGEWLEYRTCQKCNHTVSTEVSRSDGIRACLVAIQYALEFTPDRIADVIPRLVAILGREADRS